MSNNIIKLLGFEDPAIEVSGFKDSGNQRIITVSKKAVPTFCPVCESRMHSKGIYTRTVNHPIMQDGRQIILKLQQRRYKCINPACGYTKNDEFSFVDPGRRNSNLTDYLLVMAFKDPNMTAAQIAARFNVSDTYAIETFARYVDMPRRQLTEAICIDEVYVDINYRCKYAMVIQDFITGEPIDMLPSRREEFTEPYFASIPPAQRNRVKYLVTDMYRPYLSFVDKYFPNAVSVIDSFHVVKMINNHLRQYIMKLIRKYRDIDLAKHETLEQQLGRRIDFTASKEYYLLKNFQWIILKNNDDINYSSPSRFNHKLRRYLSVGDIEYMLFEIDPALRDLRNLKEKYIRFNRDYGGKYKEARTKLMYIIEDYEGCPYPIFHTIAESLRYHFIPITNSFIMVERHCNGNDHVKRLSNGPAEALNRIVKDMKRNGRGYRNFEHLRNRFLFSQRKNAAILGTPRSREDACPKTGIKRGPYIKKSKYEK